MTEKKSPSNIHSLAAVARKLGVRPDTVSDIVRLRNIPTKRAFINHGPAKAITDAGVNRVAAALGLKSIPE